MRLGYVLKSFPRLSETFILTEILELERLGCQVTIFSRHAPEEPVRHGGLGSLRAEVVDLEPMLRDRLWEPFEAHRRLARQLGPAHAEAEGAALAARQRDELRHWLLAGVVAEAAIARGLDLIHGHFATGSASIARYAGRLSGLPFSFTAHAKDIYADQVDTARLRLLMKEAAVVITISDANATFLRSICPPERVERIYNGVDLDLFTPLEAPPRPDPPLLLFVGRMVEKKGLLHLIEACAALRRSGIPARCRLVGAGPLEGSLRERASALVPGEAVEFNGPASQEEVARVHLPEASVFVQPCMIAPDGDRDGIPTTLLEAMARGVPVVSTSLPGIPEAVPDGEAGLLANPGDVAGLSEAIARTLAEPQATLRRARNARSRVERLFDARRNAGHLLETFRSLAGAGRNAVGGWP